MSKLEAENIPVIGEMLLDKPMDLDEEKQELVSVWAVKTAMMSDSMKGRNAANKFYSHDECLNSRVSRIIPPRTLIWIGRVDGMHLADVGNDFTLNYPDGNRRLATNIATTIGAGHFITQVVTVHMEDEGVNIDSVPCKLGNWADRLIQIWPVLQPIVHWPPNGSFTNGGPDGVAYLMDRWRIGEETDIISASKFPG
jgi:hypothetical protein